LGAATSALVAQAQKQAANGDFSTATTTLERALRIEPDNPLLWIEIGKVRMSEGNAAQADSMGRKALALGRGDPVVQAAAWRLIAESLRARGRNAEAADALDRANALVPR
jgi:Flp pilus assembly protein TadD